MEETLEARVARLESELEQLRAVVEQLSLWVTGTREPVERKS